MQRDLFSAVAYAVNAHKDQKRKYTGEPYVLHPVEVAKTLENNWQPREVVIAGLFHDILEDTQVTEAEMRRDWGDKITDLVVQVTDVSTPADGNRAQRKAIDLAHLAGATAEAQNIKYADIISNTKSIAEHDSKFAEVYLPEIATILGTLREGDGRLFNEAVNTWELAMMKLGNHSNEMAIAKMCNYVVTIHGAFGTRETYCNTEEQVWRAIGSNSFGGIHSVVSPVGLDTSVFTPY